MKTRSDLTFKHNIKHGRHGWLRLTPAYSVKVVGEILDAQPFVRHVLDPFSGTGTTGLVCAERGLQCDLLDINPFLIWFAKAKTANYSLKERLEAQRAASGIVDGLRRKGSENDLWFPRIKNIERWWTEEKRTLLSQIHREINRHFAEETPSKNLLLVAFCRIVIDWSSAAFNHQSMSFKEHEETLFDYNEREELLAYFESTVQTITDAAAVSIPGQVSIKQADSRCVPSPMSNLYDCVITSPPYPNRMSYIRELRPYMYWLGYLDEAREAGELDWQAIGGTWGIATSRVEKWRANGTQVRHAGFDVMIKEIGRQSNVLANYVHKYFVDVTIHLNSMYLTLAPGGKVFYVVGNSKFYDTLVPVEEIYASLLTQCGFSDAEIVVIRKRNSKKELRELIVSAIKPL